MVWCLVKHKDNFNT